MNEAIPLGSGQGNEQFKYNSEQKKYLTEKNGTFYGGDYIPELPEEIIIPGTALETDAPGVSKQSYREIGAANRAAFKEKIEKKKSWFRDLFTKFGSQVKDTKESVIDHAFATREMAADGMVSANNFIDNKIVNPIDAKVQQGEVWIDKKLEQGKNYAEMKKQQMTAWKQDKVETGKAIAALVAIKTMDGVQILKEGAQEKVNFAKEKVAAGYEKVTSAGQAAVAAAEQKRKSLFSAAREKMNQIKLGFLSRQLAQEQAKATMAREELEAREAKMKLIEQKMALLNVDFVGGTQEATA